MSSKKDLVEAHSFNRRRLITAFVSGAPGGREVEPVRYGRTLVGGLVLAALVVAGAAVSPLLRPSLPKDWQQNGMVVGKESGSRFVAYKGTLYPVINTTSARLILASEGTFDVNFVPDDKIAEQKQGPTIGIPGAPDLLPTSANLVQSGWVACTSRTNRGIRVTLDSEPGVSRSTDSAFVVSSETDGSTHVIAGEHQYAVPPGAGGNVVLRGLGLDGEEPQPVPGLWLDLISPGPLLEPFVVQGAGSKIDTGAAGLDTVGTPVKVDGRPYVLSREGLLPLTDFAYTLYRSSGIGAQLPEQQVSLSQVTKVRTVNDPKRQPYPSDWPESDVSAYDRGDAPCLQLTTDPKSGPTVRLVAPTSEGPVPSSSGVSRTVQSGHGALVRVSTAGVLGSGTTFLVDATGTRYAVGTQGAAASALVSLGYRDEQPVAVPPAWMDLFGDGPALTATAAAKSAGSQS